MKESSGDRIRTVGIAALASLVERNMAPSESVRVDQ